MLKFPLLFFLFQDHHTQIPVFLPVHLQIHLRGVVRVVIIHVLCILFFSQKMLLKMHGISVGREIINFNGIALTTLYVCAIYPDRIKDIFIAI